MKKTFFSHGKLLLTSEYLVLDGAMALAIPCIKGQLMTVEVLPGSGNIHWTAKDESGKIWLHLSFILQASHLIPITLGKIESNPEEALLRNIIEKAISLNPDFLTPHSDYEIITHLQFPGNWGLGSSSTLIANIAAWFGIDAMRLFSMSLEGSGYDIAIAIEAKPILYAIENKKTKWTVVTYQPPFANELFFIHLGNKQNSRDEIVKYLSKTKPESHQIKQISDLTHKIFECRDIHLFMALITEHEDLIAECLNTSPIKKRLFNDFGGAIKSLGAWGGDFILATGTEAKDYFYKKGYKTVLGWNDMVKP